MIIQYSGQCSAASAFQNTQLTKLQEINVEQAVVEARTLSQTKVVRHDLPRRSCVPLPWASGPLHACPQGDSLVRGGSSPSSHSPVVHSGSCGRWVSQIWRSNSCRRLYYGVHFRNGQGSFEDGASFDPVPWHAKEVSGGDASSVDTTKLARRQVVMARP